MANSANYRVQLRRRRAGKTDYQARKALVISRRARLVARSSIKNVTAQIIIAKPQGDQVLAAANSRELVKKYGWKAATGNIPAAYLTGLLCGLKAKAAGINEAILDIGMVIPTKGSKVFAVLNGVLDAGIEIPHSEEKIVKERTKGDHIAKYAKSLGAGSEDYNAKFSQVIAKHGAPEKLPEHFSKVRADVIGSFKDAKLPPEAVIEEKAAPKEKEPAKEKTVPAKEKVPAAKETKEKTPKAKDEIQAKTVPEKVVNAEKVSKPKAAKEKTVKEKAPKAAKAKAPSKKAPAKPKAAKEKAPKGEKKE
jgi:large subunit ribosomal protein L18